MTANGANGVIYKWGIEFEAGFKHDIYGYERNSDGIFDFNYYSKRHPEIFPNGKMPKVTWRLHSEGFSCSAKITPAELVIWPPVKSPFILYRDLKLLYNMVGEINSNMGLHIHVSFNDLDTYRKLWSRAYIESFQDDVSSAFEEVKRRLSYSCYGHKFYKDSTFPPLTGTKSQCLSYQYGYYGTLEYRAFPAVAVPERAKEYLLWLRENINDFVRKHPDPSISFNENFNGNQGSIRYSLMDAIQRFPNFWTDSPLKAFLDTPDVPLPPPSPKPQPHPQPLFAIPSPPPSPPSQEGPRWPEAVTQ